MHSLALGVGRVAREARSSVWAFLVQFGAWLWSEGRTLHRVFLFGGWAALTKGVVSLTAPEVWWISVGLFGLSLAGWGHLRLLFTMGWYALTHRPADR